MTSSSRSDVLQWPVIGAFLRWPHARTIVQSLLLVVALVIVAHGLFGPQIAPTNLATVLIWVHYRGLLVLALLIAGNVFCMGCPFVLARDLGRWLHAPRLQWPRRLRTKWMALALFVAVLFAYEYFALWAWPRATALLVLAYFGAALAVDVVFTGATFCKYLCPVGQFNFAASMLSPLELGVREIGTCRTCRTVDCIKGTRLPESPRVVVQRGCELNLFLPSKIGNMDCTFCLDCVHACPHDNVMLAVRVPGAELADPGRRSGIGRLEDRRDIAALAVIFTFGALLNALGMIEPIANVEDWIGQFIGTQSQSWVLGALFVLVLGIAPFGLLTGAASVAARLTRTNPWPVGRIVVRNVYALVPFGFGMWLAHYGFHLLTGIFTVVPVTQSAVIDLLGRAALGEPRWRWAGMRPGSVFPIQVGLILLGTVGSLSSFFQIAERDYPEQPGRAFAPWMALVLILAVAAVWIVLQPMSMRGVDMGA